MTEELRTSQDWQKDPEYEGLTIMDPDGWDRKNYEYSFNEELITRTEFERRSGTSTCMMSREFLDRQVKKYDNHRLS